MNSGMGEGPNYLDPFGIIIDIASMLFNSPVFVASGGLLLLSMHMVEIGLEIIGNLLAAAWEAGWCNRGRRSARGAGDG